MLPSLKSIEQSKTYSDIKRRPSNNKTDDDKIHDDKEACKIHFSSKKSASPSEAMTAIECDEDVSPRSQLPDLIPAISPTSLTPTMDECKQSDKEYSDSPPPLPASRPPILHRSLSLPSRLQYSESPPPPPLPDSSPPPLNKDVSIEQDFSVEEQNTEVSNEGTFVALPCCILPKNPYDHTMSDAGFSNGRFQNNEEREHLLSDYDSDSTLEDDLDHENSNGPETYRSEVHNSDDDEINQINLQEGNILDNIVVPDNTNITNAEQHFQSLLSEFSRKDANDTSIDFDDEFEAIFNSLNASNASQDSYCHRFAGRRDKYGFILSPIIESPSPTPSCLSNYSGISCASPDPFSMFRVSPAPRSGKRDLDLSSLSKSTTEWGAIEEEQTVPIYQTRPKFDLYIPEASGWESGDDLLTPTSHSSEWDADPSGLSTPPVNGDIRFGGQLKSLQRANNIIYEEDESSSAECDSDDSDDTLHESDTNEVRNDNLTPDASYNVENTQAIFNDNELSNNAPIRTSSNMSRQSDSLNAATFDNDNENMKPENSSVNSKTDRDVESKDNDIDIVEQNILQTTVDAELRKTLLDLGCFNDKGSSDSDNYTEDSDDEYNEESEDDDDFKQKKDASDYNADYENNVSLGDYSECLSSTAYIFVPTSIVVSGTMTPDNIDSASSVDEDPESPNMSSFGSGIKVTQYTSGDSESSDSESEVNANDISTERDLNIHKDDKVSEEDDQEPKARIKDTIKNGSTHIHSPLDVSFLDNNKPPKDPKSRRSPRVLGRHYLEMDDTEKAFCTSPPAIITKFQNISDENNQDDKFSNSVNTSYRSLHEKYEFGDKNQALKDRFQTIHFNITENAVTTSGNFRKNGFYTGEISPVSSDSDSDTEYHQTKRLKSDPNVVPINSFTVQAPYNRHETEKDFDKDVQLSNKDIQIDGKIGKAKFSRIANSPVKIKIAHLRRKGSSRNKIKPGYVKEVSKIFSDNQSQILVEAKTSQTKPLSVYNDMDILIPNEDKDIYSETDSEKAGNGTADSEQEIIVTPLMLQHVSQEEDFESSEIYFDYIETPNNYQTLVADYDNERKVMMALEATKTCNDPPTEEASISQNEQEFKVHTLSTGKIRDPNEDISLMTQRSQTIETENDNDKMQDKKLPDLNLSEGNVSEETLAVRSSLGFETTKITQENTIKDTILIKEEAQECQQNCEKHSTDIDADINKTELNENVGNSDDAELLERFEENEAIYNFSGEEKIKRIASCYNETELKKPASYNHKEELVIDNCNVNQSVSLHENEAITLPPKITSAGGSAIMQRQLPPEENYFLSDTSANSNGHVLLSTDISPDMESHKARNIKDNACASTLYGKEHSNVSTDSSEYFKYNKRQKKYDTSVTSVSVTSQPCFHNFKNKSQPSFSQLIDSQTDIESWSNVIDQISKFRATIPSFFHKRECKVEPNEQTDRDIRSNGPQPYTRNDIGIDNACVDRCLSKEDGRHSPPRSKSEYNFQYHQNDLCDDVLENVDPEIFNHKDSFAHDEFSDSEPLLMADEADTVDQNTFQHTLYDVRKPIITKSNLIKSTLSQSDYSSQPKRNTVTVNNRNANRFDTFLPVAKCNDAKYDKGVFHFHMPSCQSEDETDFVQVDSRCCNVNRDNNVITRKTGGGDRLSSDLTNECYRQNEGVHIPERFTANKTNHQTLAMNYDTGVNVNSGGDTRYHITRINGNDLRQTQSVYHSRMPRSDISDQKGGSCVTQNTSVRVKTLDDPVLFRSSVYDRVIEDESGHIKGWPYSDIDNEDRVPVKIYKTLKNVSLEDSKIPKPIDKMRITRMEEGSGNVADDRTVKKFHSSSILPANTTEKQLMQSHSESIQEALQTDANGNMLNDEEIAKVLPKLAETIANMKNVNAEEVMPGITQTVAKLKDGGNLVITTMTRKLVEDEETTEETPPHPVLDVDDLENSKIYLVQDSKGDMFYVEDVTSESQESAYYSSSRHNSESVSDSGSSPTFQRISKIQQVGKSGINESTAEELISAMYDQNGVTEIDEFEDEYSERTYEFDLPREHSYQDALPRGGYNKDSFKTSYMVEEPDSFSIQGQTSAAQGGTTTTKDHFESSYEMTSGQPWVFDGSGGQYGSQANYSNVMQGSSEELERASTLSENDNVYRMQNLVRTSDGKTISTEKYTIEAEAFDYPQTETTYAAPPPVVYVPPPVPALPVGVQTDEQLNYSLVKVDMTPKSVVPRVESPSKQEEEKQERPIYKTVAHIETKERPRPKPMGVDMTDSKKYKIVTTKCTPVEEVQESSMSLDEVDYRMTTENIEYKLTSPTYENKQYYIRNSTVGHPPSTPERFRSEKRLELNQGSNEKHKTEIQVKDTKDYDAVTYEENNYSYDKMVQNMGNSDGNMRVVRGSYLIKNTLDEVDGSLDDNLNLFDGNFTLRKDNPLYLSDEDLYKRFEREKAENARKQERFQRDLNNDITFETVDKFSKSKEVKREERPKQSLSQLLLSRLSTIDVKDIRQHIDVKHHSEDIYGDPSLHHADGTLVRHPGTNNFDTVGEKVDLVLKEGKALITVTVTAERITPVDLEFNVWRKNQAIVTRVIEVDLLATEQRRRLYYQVMEEPGTQTRDASNYRIGPNETVLDSQQTLDLFTRILGATDGEGDKEDITVKTRQMKTTRPFSSGMDLLY